MFSLAWVVAWAISFGEVVLLNLHSFHFAAYLVSRVDYVIFGCSELFTSFFLMPNELLYCLRLRACVEYLSMQCLIDRAFGPSSAVSILTRLFNDVLRILDDFLLVSSLDSSVCCSVAV